MVGASLEGGVMKWTKLHNEEGIVVCDEAQVYLFCIELAGGTWEFFTDCIVWDAETPPAWGEGYHGWELSDVHWYAELDQIPTPGAQPAPDTEVERLKKRVAELERGKRKVVEFLRDVVGKLEHSIDVMRIT